MNQTTPKPDEPKPFCDIVMKGGITSGIVYPPLAEALSKTYLFKNIGGTSAGAIAAAATAAAEYQRRTTGKQHGFDELGKLPQTLGADVEDRWIKRITRSTLSQLGLAKRMKSLDDWIRKTKLSTLFQPDPGCQKLFDVLMKSLNAKTSGRRAGSITWAFVSVYWLATFVALAATAISWWALGFVGAALPLTWGGQIATLLICGLPTFLLLTVIAVGGWVYFDFTRKVTANDYGICTGMRQNKEAGKNEALTEWLHSLIQRLAGLPLNSPLTFGDLWKVGKSGKKEGGIEYPPDWMNDLLKTHYGYEEGKYGEYVKALDVDHAIDLRMFTTNLSTGRPFVLPFEDEIGPLFIKHRDLDKYLPEEVATFMKDSYTGREPASNPEDHEPWVKLVAGKLPVVLAARLSLSFPLLFSAIPLWMKDESNGGKYRRCIFSDGGISSNFPIHMFDGLLPMWPTFGVELDQTLPGGKSVYLPPNYDEGYGERWNAFDEDKGTAAPKSGAAHKMGGFLAAVIGTMQNWNDNSVSRMPGVRDRVVRLRLEEGQGGMNLKMEKDPIDKMAKKGTEAAGKLMESFSANGASGWHAQRLLRLRVTFESLRKRINDAAIALKHKNGAYNSLINTANAMCTDPVIPCFDTGEERSLAKAVRALKTFHKTLKLLPDNSPKRTTGHKFTVCPATDLKVRHAL